jgi:hypothetical protein
MFDESPSRSSRQFKLLKVEKNDESDFWSEASTPTNITEHIADSLVLARFHRPIVLLPITINPKSIG